MRRAVSEPRIGHIPEAAKVMKPHRELCFEGYHSAHGINLPEDRLGAGSGRSPEWCTTYEWSRWRNAGQAGCLMPHTF
jgi:hypothetical protein